MGGVGCKEQRGGSASLAALQSPKPKPKASVRAVQHTEPCWCPSP